LYGVIEDELRLERLMLHRLDHLENSMKLDISTEADVRTSLQDISRVLTGPLLRSIPRFPSWFAAPAALELTTPRRL
jgi:hypothetical protein